MTEQIKENSNYLRGSIAKDLTNQITGSLDCDNGQLIKFHGIYEQDDRDRRAIRALKKLEKDYSFMIRLRIAGGKISAKQWLGIAQISDQNSSGIVKITTRQTVQINAIIKSKLKPTIKYFDQYGLDSIAACGDVNRNVIASTGLIGSKIQNQLYQLAVKISEEFLPKSTAYQEIWLDQENISKKEEEPIYGKSYLPRKFKIALALPPYNDVDVFAHDIGLIAITQNQQITGFNIVVGGGMGSTHNNSQTYPRLGSLIGYVDIQNILPVIEKIILIQRDFGNRQNRKQARLKYTIDHLGLDWFVGELQKRLGFKLQKAKKFQLTSRADQLGWSTDFKGLNHFGLFIENGLVKGNIKKALNEIAKENLANFCFTNNQNIIISNVRDQKPIDDILSKYDLTNNQSNIRKNAMACVALNTCPLALAEGQRYLPILLNKIEDLLAKHHLSKEEITIRMTGCPNGCARPYLAEIGLIGKSLGKYNLHLGGNKAGDRLNVLYQENLDEKAILKQLDHLFGLYVCNANKSQSFSDFVKRKILPNNQSKSNDGSKLLPP